MPVSKINNFTPCDNFKTKQSVKSLFLNIINFKSNLQLAYLFNFVAS